jgi:hypothetical protein
MHHQEQAMHTHKVTSALSILGTLLAPEVSVTSLAWDNILLDDMNQWGESITPWM